jgi:hypothetical protein
MFTSVAWTQGHGKPAVRPEVKAFRRHFRRRLEAIQRNEPLRREGARPLLARWAAAPKEQYRVEDAHYAALARDLLARVRYWSRRGVSYG